MHTANMGLCEQLAGRQHPEQSYIDRWVAKREGMMRRKLACMRSAIDVFQLAQDSTFVGAVTPKPVVSERPFVETQPRFLGRCEQETADMEPPRKRLGRRKRFK